MLLSRGGRIFTHIGTTRLAAPIASPTMLLPAIIPHTDPVTACHSAPAVKRTSAIRIIFCRPSLSARIPARGLAIRAKRLVQDVISDLSSVVRGRLDRSLPMETRVEDMTPVLHANVSCLAMHVEQAVTDS